MTEQTGRAAVACPSCSPDLETVHEVLTTGGGKATLRCTECGHVHKEALPDERTVERRVVVSQDGESFTASVEVPPRETLRRGEEFVLDTDDAIMEVRITDLQVSDEERTTSATGEDVDTIWTRAVGNVSVDVTVNPSDGAREGTHSVTVYVPGDYEFVVGETDAFGDDEFTVTGLYLRDDARGYDFQRLKHDGDAAQAKDIERAYAVDETTDAWSPW